MKKYIIRIVWTDSKQIEYIDLRSANINWSMEQYSRNREPFNWSVVKIED